MRISTRIALLVGLLVSTWQSRSVQADAATDDSAVIARVGDRTITAGELSRKIAALPPFQLRSFGRTPEEARRNFLEQVLIRDALLASGAQSGKLEQRDDVAERIRKVLRSAMLARLEAEVIAKGEVSDADVKKYYEENTAKFRSPPRYSIWRIQVATREEAKKILDELKADPSPKRWSDLAREKSLDKATNMRGGNLGFVTPDGTTTEASIKVDPAMMRAVIEGKDAEILPEPIKDGDRFSVVWRRQSIKGIDRPLEAESSSIRQTLARERMEKQILELIERLRKESVKELRPEAIDLLDVAKTGDLQPLRRPGTLDVRKPAVGSPAPSGAGLR